MLLIEIALYFLVVLASVISNGPALSQGFTAAEISREASQLTNLGNGYAALCQATNFACDGVGTSVALTSGAAPTEAGYVPVVFTPPVGSGAAYDIAVTASYANSAENGIVVYSTAQIDGSQLQSFQAMTVTASGTAEPTVSAPTVPKAGTKYTMAYDSCLSGVYVTTAATPASACN